ncbi:hypothetical protein D3C85_1490190 [compost metagenome]
MVNLAVAQLLQQRNYALEPGEQRQRLLDNLIVERVLLPFGDDHILQNAQILHYRSELRADGVSLPGGSLSSGSSGPACGTTPFRVPRCGRQGGCFLLLAGRKHLCRQIDAVPPPADHRCTSTGHRQQQRD